MMSLEKVFLAVLVMAGVTFFTRALPFVFFAKRRPPSIVVFLEKYIPPMVMMILVVYCLKDIDMTASPYGIPEIVSVVFVVIIHMLVRNPLVSIFGGTLLYMIIVQSEMISSIL
jgi:branched-subunit amino acid transport protein AzlD